MSRPPSTPRARFARRAPVALVAAVLVAACADAETADTGGFIVTDSAGVVLVRNPEFVDGARPPRLVPDLRIGVVEGAPEYQFTQIFGIAEGSAGDVHVLDFRSYNVRVFDPEGRHLRTLGRRGEGPGEIERGVGLRVVAGDTVLVLEGPLGWRLHAFAPDGSHIETRTYPRGPDRIMELTITAAGHVLMQSSRRAPDGSRLTDILLRTDFASQTADTIRELLPAPSEGRVLNGGSPAWTLLEDGRIVVGRTDEYRFEYLRPDGSVERVVTREGAPRRLTEAEKAALLAVSEERAARLPSIPTPLGGIRPPPPEPTVADALPYYRELVAGPRSTLWVSRYPGPEEFTGQSDGVSTWDVFDAEGKLLGSIELEGRYPPRWGTGEHLYRVVRDALDVPYVERLRIDWGEGG